MTFANEKCKEIKSSRRMWKLQDSKKPSDKEVRKAKEAYNRELIEENSDNPKA